KEAQAIGDLQAVENHRRRILRLHLSAGTDITRIGQIFSAALGKPAAAEPHTAEHQASPAE
ncbi:MAG: hypothetical protein ACM3JD_18270, partial [Rudaea sp.]